MISDMSACILCPRKCNKDRTVKNGTYGVCGQSDEIKIARAALHFWEEPCISGKNGSGAVFFSGCSLNCIFCQNRSISHGGGGRLISTSRLSDIFLELQDKGAENINLVTPTHFIPQIIEALDTVKDKSLKIPVVYNTSGYEKAESLRMLDGYIDIYLPDFKYMDKDIAGKFSQAANYPEYADAALEEMYRQIKRADHTDCGIVSRKDKEGICVDDIDDNSICVMDDRGMMKRGIIVRHLVLPGHVNNTKAVLDHLFDKYGNRIFYSIMNQYTPPENIMLPFEELNRKLTDREYDKAVDHALRIGITNAFIQEGGTVGESFIPEFDMTGV